MAVKLRLARLGKKNAPMYRIVAIDSQKRRDGACIENLGTYDPRKKVLVQFHEERVKDWISKGAIPSDTVRRLHKDYRAKSAVAAK
jgi:small subunit ribosomal protein S16